jgi:receptor protein-tyrosine kinase
MKRDRRTQRGAREPSFEVLRGRIESGVERPGVVAVTSAISGDGKSATAQGLAAALAAIGYRTLLIDAGKRSGALIQPATSASIEATLIESACDTAIAGLSVASLTNPTLQRRASLQNVGQALAAVRESYDYVVVDADCALTSAFSAHLVGSADAVLVTVRAGRKQHSEDMRLAEALADSDLRFFGVVAVSPAIIGSTSSLIGIRNPQPDRAIETRRLNRESFLRNARPSIEL